MRLIDADALINDRENFIVIGAGDNICIDISDIEKAHFEQRQRGRPTAF